MRAILSFWYHSLLLFLPSRLWGLLKSSTRTFGRTLKQLVTNFIWLIVIDVAIFLIFGDIFAKANAMHLKTGTFASGPIMLMMLARSVIWFLITSAFFLLMRKGDQRDPREYVKVYFFRYVQLLIFFSLLLLVGLYLLTALGITKIPHAPWWSTLIFRTIEYTTALFWLDSTSNLKNMLFSFEKTINLIFYNLPFTSVLIGLLWLFDYVARMVLTLVLTTTPTHIILNDVSELLVMPDTPLPLLIKMVLIKYALFVLEAFWLSLLVSFYRRRKDIVYATSVLSA
jgi:hypothetical protein